MKFILILLASLNSYCSFCQKAYDILNGKLKKELENRNVFIKKTTLKKDEVEANDKLMALSFRNFSFNSTLLTKSILYPEPILSCLPNLGRQFFKDNLPLSLKGFASNNMLYGLTNGKLFSIVDPDPGQSYFRIYYGLNNILNGAGKIEASTNVLNIIKGQVNAAIDYQTDRNCQFTAMVITFKNFLVESFDRFKQGNIADNDIDLFMNLYDLYSNSTLGITERNYIIGYSLNYFNS